MKRLDFMRKLSVCAALVLLAGMVASVPAHAFQPRDARETDAVNVRILQSEMMVAALACDMRQNYNSMISHFKQELVEHGRVLRRMFRRDHGGGAQKALDGFITQLANDASIRSSRARGEFCVNADQMFSALLSGERTLADTGLRTVEDKVTQSNQR